MGDGVHNLSFIEKRLQVSRMSQTHRFKYLVSTIQKEGEVENTHSIKTRRFNWRAAMGVLCDKKVMLKSKGEIPYGSHQTNYVAWIRVLANEEGT